MSCPVKLFSSNDLNAPKLSGTVGALIPLLDACLITGYNVQPVNKLLIVAGVATATTNAIHGFKVGDVVALSGATDEGLNTEFVVTAADNNNFSFKVDGSPTSPATGSISAKKAAAGWSKPFSGANKAVYKSTNPLSKGFCLRIDDADARYTRARGFEAMTDIDNGTGLFPTVAQVSLGLTWAKSLNTNSTAVEWLLVADDRTFYFFPRCWPTQGNAIYYFGDLLELVTNDLYSVVINGSTLANTGSAYTDNSGGSVRDGTTGKYMAREMHGAGGSVSAPANGFGSQTYSGYSVGYPFPNPTGNLLITAPILISTPDSGVRGSLAGIYQPLHNQPLTNGDIFNGLMVNGLSRSCVIVDFAVDTANRGRFAVDITGPWR